MASVAVAAPAAAKAEEERARAPPEPVERDPKKRRKLLTNPARSPLLAADKLQLKGMVSSPTDAAEVEADRVASQVMSMAQPPAAPSMRVAATIQRAAATAPAPAPSGESKGAAAVIGAVRGAAGGGAKLPRSTRAFLEPRFGADFSGVRVHTGPQAKKLAGGLEARAFTYGRDVFFNEGEYRPDSPDGRQLLAHELTHTIQQRGVIQRKDMVQVRSEPHLQRGLRDWAKKAAGAVAGAARDVAGAVTEFVGDVLKIVKDFVADKATIVPGFDILCLVLGKNPINDAPAPGGGKAILQKLAGWIPFGDKVIEALNNHKIIDKGGAFIDQQIAGFKALATSVIGAIGAFFSTLGPGDALNPGGAWDRAKTIFSTPIDNMKSFASGLISGFVTLVREVIVKPLGKWAAANVPKWDLLMAVLGQNPISDEGESPVSQIIGAFMNLIGQGEIWENIKKGKAVDRAWAWFQNALKGAKSLVSQLPGLVISTIKSLTIMDVLTIVGAFQKIVGAFGSFVGSFFTWALGTVLDLLEIILSVVAPGAVPYLKKAGGAFSKIIKDPITFVRTLVAAGKAGFQNFAGNFLTHLKAALIGWLTGSLSGAGVYIPQGFTVLELLKFVLSVLGLTWANLRGKLVKATNETVVSALEAGFHIVKTLVTEGPAAAWQEIVKSLTNLKQMAIDAVMDFVKSKIVEIAVTKLLSMLSPAGAFIQALIAIYNTIMFFVERIRQIAAVAASFIDSIAAIASGNIGPASARVEKTLAGLLVLVISFLARLAGLGKVSDAVLGLVKKIRAPIDKALDSVVAWIVAQARKLGKFIAQAGVPQDPNARLQLAIRDATAIARGLGNRISRPNLERALAVVSTRYALTRLAVAERAGVWTATATINPTLTAQIATAAPGAGGAGAPQRPLPATTTLIRVTPPFVKGRNSQNQQAEYDRQVGMQQAGICAMTVAEWERNRASYVARRSAPGSRSGRDPATAVDQANLRARVLDEMTRRLALPLLTPTTFPSLGIHEHGAVTGIFNANPMSGTRDNRVQGFTTSRAAALAQSWLSTQHALHSPDQVAGGSRLNAAGGVAPDRGLTGLGLAGVNMSIGSQWGTSGQARVLSISSQLTAFLATGCPGGPVTTDAEKGRIRMNVTMLPVL